MIKKIKLCEKQVRYTLKLSRRARRLRLAVYCDGNFVVTAPRGLDMGLVEKFILQKSKWVVDKLEYFKRLGNGIFIKKKRGGYLKYKQKAQSLVKERVLHFNQLYGFAFNKINIKKQKTRWGSCSQKGNLNFNYKIALLPQELADYIIVHELCHLGQLNHSKKFWQLVARAIPNFSKIRKELRAGIY